TCSTNCHPRVLRNGGVPNAARSSWRCGSTWRALTSVTVCPSLSKQIKQASPSSGTLSSVMHWTVVARSSDAASRLLASARKLARDPDQRLEIGPGLDAVDLGADGIRTRCWRVLGCACIGGNPPSEQR